MLVVRGRICAALTRCWHVSYIVDAEDDTAGGCDCAHCRAREKSRARSAAAQTKAPRVNHYAELEITEYATPAEIKKAYRVMAMQWHPDKHSDSSEEQQHEVWSVRVIFVIFANPCLCGACVGSMIAAF